LKEVSAEAERVARKVKLRHEGEKPSLFRKKNREL